MLNYLFPVVIDQTVCLNRKHYGGNGPQINQLDKPIRGMEKEGDTLRVFCQVMDKEEILYEYSAVPNSRANLALNLLNRLVKMIFNFISQNLISITIRTWDYGMR